MSLETLRELRRSGLRPHAVTLVTKACPKPQWRWLADDPTRVYLPKASDVRSHDLRPLVGLKVVALVDSLDKRRAQVIEALTDVKAQLVGICDGADAECMTDHPWPAEAEKVLMSDWRFEWNF